MSQLDRADDDQPARKFFRPKGSVTLGWRPSKGWDVSLKLRRRVGQISFYDFLAQPKLSQDRENAGNPDLVPPQSWEAETEFSRDLGRWGKTRLNLHYYRVSDIVDVIPIGDNRRASAISRAPTATAPKASARSISIRSAGRAPSSTSPSAASGPRCKDPLTGEKRPITGIQDRWGSRQIRHDIPGTPWAWDAYVQHRHYTKNYFLTEVFRELDMPVDGGLLCRA